MFAEMRRNVGCIVSVLDPIELIVVHCAVVVVVVGLIVLVLLFVVLLRRGVR